MLRVTPSTSAKSAQSYFQELLKRYPKTNWKKDASDQLKNLARDAKNKAVCAS